MKRWHTIRCTCMHGVSDEGGFDCKECQQIAKDLGLPGPDFTPYIFNNEYHVERLRRHLARETES